MPHNLLHQSFARWQVLRKRGIRPSLLVLACALAAPAGVKADPREVHVASGALVGIASGSVISFKGIPYAAPPIGELRWRAPGPAPTWNKTRRADDFGASCLQSSPPSRVPSGSQAEHTSEDCLTLNVWAPSPPLTKAPVMVWIHGGSNTHGSGAGRYYDGTAFAQDGVVLVTFNYRLGLPGFFAHPALTKEAPPGLVTNFGLQDQIAALQWVRKNITAFGGDPGNVTVFGESAGANDIITLMAVPAARGLFQKAIVESAALGESWLPLAEAQEMGVKVATALGLPGEKATAKELRAIPSAALVRDDDLQGFGPVIDGTLLPQAPLVAIAQGGTPDIPLVIGTNGNEASLLGPNPTIAAVADAQEDWSGLRKIYGQQAESDIDFARAVFRDLYFATPARWIAAHKGRTTSAYLYRFDYVLSLLRSRRIGADHGSEVPFVFSTWSTDRLSDADRQMTAMVHSCWVTFAQTGTPACTGGPAWPPYHADADMLMNFADRTSIRKPENSAALDALQPRLGKTVATPSRPTNE
jgi:para-nitrobenzyl esterase